MITPAATRRKIAWLSPFGPQSDIGAHSAAIVGALHRKAAKYDCELVLFVEPNGLTYGTDAPQLIMGPHFPAEILSLFDVAALNIGNNHENHAHINEIALTRGGIVVVHDIVMQHYFAGRFFDAMKMPSRYAEILCRYYGQRAIDVLSRSGVTLKDRARRYSPWDSEHAFAFPLIEPFLEKAKAVVVHSRFASEIVAGFTDAPQLQLFLPSDKKRAPREFAPAPDGKIRFCAIGHINRAKHINLCIEAFAMSDRLKAGATLRIAGGASDLHYIRELLDFVRENALQELVKFEFDVTESRLFEIKAATDVFLNLRFPNTESASGSLAEQMACGIPTIVFDSGCYREIPAGAALKIADIATPAPLSAAMEALMADRGARQRIGKAAIEFGKTRTADDYATKFLEFVVQRDFRAVSTVWAPGADFAPFPWLKRRLGAARRVESETPALFHPGERPNFRSIADLDPTSLAQYLSVGLFRQSLGPEALASVGDIVATTPRARIPDLVGRLAFYLRTLESVEPALLSQIAFGLDADALAILRGFDAKKFVTLLFLVLLGRAPVEAEIEQALATGASPGRLLRVFLQSGEFARRAPPLDLIEQLDTLATQLDAAVVSDASRWPLLGLGVALPPHELGEVMGEGWDPIEPEGAWSRSMSAKLRFRFAPSEPRDGGAVLLDMRVAKPPNSDAQSLRLILNGVEIAHIPIESPERFLVEIPLDEIQGNEAELTLNVDRLVRPSENEAGADTRALGVFLYGLKVTAGGVGG